MLPLGQAAAVSYCFLASVSDGRQGRNVREASLAGSDARRGGDVN